MTGREALRWAAGRIGPDGDDGRRAATLLLEHTAGLKGAAFLAGLDKPLPEQALLAFGQAAERAAAGEPVQYILGRWDFYGFPFKVDRRALIPRPETERLVEEALKAIPAGGPICVIDAGCGTGCVGISIKLARPDARVALCDVSDDALALARENAELLGAGVALLRADMRLPFPGGPYDVIISNPPYINDRDMAALPRGVREYEPETALRGGADGLAFVRALADRAGDSLKPGGSLFIEIGYDQADAAVEIVKAAGMAAHAIPDYAGIPRVVAARKGT